MLWVNTFGILLLTPKVIAIVKDYEKQKNLGLDPLFDPATVGIEDEENVWGTYVEKKKQRGDYENPDTGLWKGKVIMKFTKMHGIGNDYVYVNCFEEQVWNPSEVAIKVSDRHFGIGSDGLILICPSNKADFEMKMYNADGSRGEMCGNGIRCVAKYVYEYGLTDQEHISVETLGGIKYLDLTVEDGKVLQVKVDMGEPILEAEKIPIVSGT